MSVSANVYIYFSLARSITYAIASSTASMTTITHVLGDTMTSKKSYACYSDATAC